MQTVLVVDDSPEDREAIIRILDQDEVNNFRVLEAHDERSCNKHLSSDPAIDCVLLDYSMPGCDGLQLLAKILDQNDGLPVIMITGEGSEDVAVDALKLGAQDYVVKHGALQTNIPQRIVNAIEHKRMTRQLQRQQQTLRDFADILVHDLRAPLRSIRGPIEMLTQTESPIADELRKDLHQFIANGVDHMDRLVVALSAYSSVEKQEIQFGEIDTAQLFEAVRASLSHDIDATRSRVSFESDTKVIWGSFEALAQFLQNTIENGLKYNRSAEPTVHVSLTNEATNWRIDIGDNGIGIEEEFRLEVFEPFKRLHAQSTFDGTGLGLATCKLIADLHEAKVFCNPIEGGGTEFVLLLPKQGAPKFPAANLLIG